MRNVVLSISDGELAGAIGRTLQDAGQFKVYRSYASTLRELLTTCKIMRAELLLMDVKDKPGLTVPERLAAVEAVRGQLPSCRMVFFCEEPHEGVPSELVREVQHARDTYQIDAYIYTSMPPGYAASLLESL